jgi:putative protein-disulfide isomerase
LLRIVRGSMAVRVRCITDPACVWSWAVEPAVRALMVEFGANLEWTFVMGGLCRDFDAARRAELVQVWPEAAAESGMPTDPRIWHSSPPASSYPACLAVKAAQVQGKDAGYEMLRALREGLTCARAKLDETEALVTVAQATGLDADRFRADLASAAVAEAFEADLEIARNVPDVVRAQGSVRCSPSVGAERVPFPTFRFEGEDGELAWSCGWRTLEHIRSAALAAGAEPLGAPSPTPAEAFERFPRMAAREISLICSLSEPETDRALAELYADGRIRPLPVLGGRLWEVASG